MTSRFQAERHPRTVVKKILARLGGSSSAKGATLFIYHRIGGGTSNELDLERATFVRQLDLLADHDVVSLDEALDRLDAGDTRPTFVLTFDDGFEDVYDNAWPHLRERRLPFLIYLAAGFVGEAMVWEGATAEGPPGRGLTWAQLREMVDSGLCTIGNHTFSHARPEILTTEELDRCTEAVERELGVTPRHFTYPWGIAVPELEPEIRARFRSASTGELGRNLPGVDPLRLRRVPIRRTDPEEFFAAKLRGGLLPERLYAGMVTGAKASVRLFQRVRPSSA
ncbi:polysaccharide deacetylase family protein [Aestuariimicrobium ganziense]|uniref:polysaccharide deacetylase family protein n=1 Tax=Aestuariimicrobium ganziense TaxID=2773677 RepID=UPI001941F0C5|nr:polysaccharide deacetylase family protein [Aestuariimicrobium ganziense]